MFYSICTTHRPLSISSSPEMYCKLCARPSAILTPDQLINAIASTLLDELKVQLTHPCGLQPTNTNCRDEVQESYIRVVFSCVTHVQGSVLDPRSFIPSMCVFPHAWSRAMPYVIHAWRIH